MVIGRPWASKRSVSAPVPPLTATCDDGSSAVPSTWAVLLPLPRLMVIWSWAAAESSSTESLPPPPLMVSVVLGWLARAVTWFGPVPVLTVVVPSRSSRVIVLPPLPAVMVSWAGVEVPGPVVAYRVSPMKLS